jgi:spondin N
MTDKNPEQPMFPFTGRVAAGIFLAFVISGLTPFSAGAGLFVSTETSFSDNYDAAPDALDGFVDSRDLLVWFDRIRSGTPGERVFDFSRFWQRPSAPASATATYRVTFDATWSAQSHPTSFPPNAHFSGLVGGTHNGNVSFWQVGGLASPGIEIMAEQGGQSLSRGEVTTAIGAGNAGEVILGSSFNSPGSTGVTFQASQDFSLVTLVSMIAPTPDWFVGVSGLPLFNGTNWEETVVGNLQPYDSGTDSGPSYTSPNQDTNPQEPIFEIETAPFLVGETVPPLGTFTFQRME